MSQSSFSTDFASARARFREAAAAADAILDSFAHPERGPDEEPLSTDVAWIGPADASKVIVMASGTHGVEGFCGAGVQVEWLRRAKDMRLPIGTAALLVHAINPYGFAWLRRVTHENIDLNRNWHDFNAKIPDNPAYDTIADLLCPKEWTQESRSHSLAGIQSYIKNHGLQAFAQAASSGQHSHPDGLFYGGTAPCWSRDMLTAILIQRLSQAQHIAIIDLHSGLGLEGFGELIASAPVGTAAFSRARAWYGASVQTIGEQGDEFARIAGDWISAAPNLLPGAAVTAIAVEFGTVNAIQVLEALRADNWLHAHGDPCGPEARDIKMQMRAAFYLDNDLWKGMVLGQSLAVCRNAIAGLQHFTDEEMRGV